MYDIPDNTKDVVRQDVAELFAAVLYKRGSFDYSTDGIWKDTMSFSSYHDDGYTSDKHKKDSFVRFTEDEKKKGLAILRDKGYHLLKSVWYSSVNYHRLYAYTLYEVKPSIKLSREDSWMF